MGVTFTDSELLYSAGARCHCGAGLAYPLDHEKSRLISAWVCRRLLQGEADLRDGDHDVFPWAFYKIREETSINNRSGLTTRPDGTKAMTIGRATCPQCQHAWESEPYIACGLKHHWFPGDCPKCGYGVGGHGSHQSSDGPAICTGYPDVVLGSVRPGSG